MRILVVEDEHKIANAIKKGLEQESFAVDVAYNGPNGMGNAMVHEYDLVILDRMLPGVKDGLEICQAMRKKDIQTPVLLLTARDKIEDKVAGLNNGADDYLIKPFAFEELLARIRALLRRPNQTLSAVLSANNLTLNTNSFEVKRGKQEIQLTTKEYALLEFLLRNKNKIVTKDQIIARVWDFDADILPNTVEVFIGYLRKKIDQKNETPLIQTVRGFGYKLKG